jgi:hypothetical protein
MAAERIAAGQIKEDDVTVEGLKEHGCDEGRHFFKGAGPRRSRPRELAVSG